MSPVCTVLCANQHWLFSYIPPHYHLLFLSHPLTKNVIPVGPARYSPGLCPLWNLQQQGHGHPCPPHLLWQQCCYPPPTPSSLCTFPQRRVWPKAGQAYCRDSHSLLASLTYHNHFQKHLAQKARLQLTSGASAPGRRISPQVGRMSNGVKGSARPPTEITMHIFSKERVPAIAIKRWLGDTNSRASLVWVQQWRCSCYRRALCRHSQRLHQITRCPARPKPNPLSLKQHWILPGRITAYLGRLQRGDLFLI